MNDLQAAMHRTDEAERTENATNHVAAVAFNSVLEAMFQLHGRTRLSGSDFKRADIIRRALLDLPEPTIAERQAADVGNMDPVPSTPLLDAIEKAVTEAVNDQQAAKQAAQ